jgi:hypothetical protein
MKVRIEIYLSPKKTHSVTDLQTISYLPVPTSNKTVIKIVEAHSKYFGVNISLN